MSSYTKIDKINQELIELKQVASPSCYKGSQFHYVAVKMDYEKP